MNAKELSLSKLNATTKMIGMYTYGLTIGDKTYKTLANIRALNPVTIKNDELLSALAYVGNDYDSALILSALLSLATDSRHIIKSRVCRIKYPVNSGKTIRVSNY